MAVEVFLQRLLIFKAFPPFCFFSEMSLSPHFQLYPLSVRHYEWSVGV